jgi:hypothetical protein
MFNCHLRLYKKKCRLRLWYYRIVNENGNLLSNFKFNCVGILGFRVAENVQED